jgi:hypothetical protein
MSMHPPSSFAAPYVSKMVGNKPHPSSQSAGVMKGKPLFPPCFDTHGGAYVFHSQTGYFLEPVSDYYYCPKSKLYYNSVEGTYYRHTEVGGRGENPFRRFDPPLPLESPVQNTSADLSDANQLSSAESRKPVSMSLGGGPAGKGKSKSGAITITSMSKKTPAAIDIAKWESAYKDADDDVATASAFSKPKASDDVAMKIQQMDSVSIQNALLSAAFASAPMRPATSSSSSSSSSVPAAATVTSQPVLSEGAAVGFACFLCRRQFDSAEKLGRHEKESKLHADNVLKAASQQQQQAVVGGGDSVYRDRAQERREIHGEKAEVLADRAAKDRWEKEKEKERGPPRRNNNPSDHQQRNQVEAKQIPEVVAVSEDQHNPGKRFLCIHALIFEFKEWRFLIFGYLRIFALVFEIR